MKYLIRSNFRVKVCCILTNENWYIDLALKIITCKQALNDYWKHLLGATCSGYSEAYNTKVTSFYKQFSILKLFCSLNMKSIFFAAKFCLVIFAFVLNSRTVICAPQGKVWNWLHVDTNNWASKKCKNFYD